MFSASVTGASRACSALARRPSAVSTLGRIARRSYHGSQTKAAAAVATAMPTGMTQDVFSMPSVGSLPPAPALRKQLNITDRLYKPEFYEAVSSIMAIREKYVQERFVFMEGAEMVPLLRKLGATDDDFERLQQVSDRLYQDPTLPFRRSRNGRFCIDMDTQSIRRLEFQPFALSVDEDFKRHDSGQVRVFDEVEDELQLNTAFQALMVFKAAVIHGVDIAQRAKLNYDVNKWVCTLFNLRTVTTPKILGEPALEGVHSDGVDHTMTTYLGSRNMMPHSAVTFMHDMAEETGIPVESTKTTLLKARAHHRHFLDTLVIVDHENKHSLSPVYQVDPDQEATRDMLIFFTRRPVEAGHISSSIDSLVAHEELPMEVPLFIPNHTNTVAAGTRNDNVPVPMKK